MLVHPDRQQLSQMLTLLRQGEVQVTVAGEYTLAEGRWPIRPSSRPRAWQAVAAHARRGRPGRMNGITELGLGWLFLSAFTSATLLPGSSEVLLGPWRPRGVEHGQPAAVGDAGQYPRLHDHLVARLARHLQEKPEDFQGRGEQKPSAGSNNMATGVCCWPGRR